MERVRLASLIEEARREQTPQVSVADSVMAEIEARRISAAAGLSGPFVWMAAASSAVAAMAMVAALATSPDNVDAVEEILRTVSWVAQ